MVPVLNRLLDYLVLDIETIPFEYKRYKELFPASKKKPGLHAVISEIVCVCVYAYDHQLNTMTLTVVDRQKHESEESLLMTLERVLFEHMHHIMVTYNGKWFDLPMIRHRSAKYGLHPILPERKSPTNVDMYEILGGKWEGDTVSCPLDQVCWSLYGEEPQEFDGSEIQVLWEAHELKEIAKKCQTDVERTNRLYRDFVVNKTRRDK